MGPEREAYVKSSASKDGSGAATATPPCTAAALMNGGAAADAPPQAQMTFRLATEQQLDAEENASQQENLRSSKLSRDDHYGVQSLPESMHTLLDSPLGASGHPATRGPTEYSEDDRQDRQVKAEAEEEDKYPSSQRRSTLKPVLDDQLAPGGISGLNSMASSAASSSSSTSSPSRSSQTDKRHQPWQGTDHEPAAIIPHSITSFSLDSQAASSSSLPSSPKSMSNRSLRPSDGEFDDTHSQAVVSSSSDDDQDAPSSAPKLTLSARADSSTSAHGPQFVMPSISMPQRRPFTVRGSNLGKLKIMVTGASGVGKTSLIKAMTQACEDIVHVDPLHHDLSSSGPAPSSRLARRTTSSQTCKPEDITEIYVSTRPYPTWWSSIDSSRILRQGTGSESSVLERNVCFVDTPGYDKGMSKMEVMDSVLAYVEGQLDKSLSPSQEAGEIVRLLSGSGGCLVDLVLYLLPRCPTQEDTIYIRRLAAHTNVVICIPKSDLISHEECEIIWRGTHEHVQDLCLFAFPTDDTQQPTSIYKVCSAPSTDDDNMDASVLMSSEYVQPLIPSDLAALVSQAFNSSNAARLRHTAASKAVRFWHRATPKSDAWPTPAFGSSAHQPLSFPDTVIARPGSFMSAYNKARLYDHTQQEENLARVRLARWAADLQRGLQNERERYENLAHEERVAWLREQLHEASYDGIRDSVAANQQNQDHSEGGKSARTFLSNRKLNHAHKMNDSNDPLGIFRWTDNLTEQGWAALQLAGGVGILGAFAIWMARTWSSNEGLCAQWTWPTLKNA